MNIEYRRATLDDAAGFVALFSDPDVMHGTLQLPSPSVDLWRKRLETTCLDPTQFQLVALADGVLIASAGLHPITQSLRMRHVVGLGMGIARLWWGKGIGSELMRRLLDWADNWAGILRVELGVYTDNARAIALYEKFGFEREGVQRAMALRDGAYVDSMMMGRLHPKQPMIRKT